MHLPEQFLKSRKLETLVENRTSYTLENAEINVYETHQFAERVFLKFGQPVVASMIRGKKIMHLQDHQSFNFLPGESLILPADEVMCIDFPEAREKNPTRCLAMTISEEKIGHTLELMNEGMPRTDGELWDLMDYSFRFTNDAAIYRILQRLLFLFSENHPLKEVFVEDMLKELIIRILQTNARKAYTDGVISPDNNRLAFVIKYIRKNLEKPLTIDELSKKACMSKSHFSRVFKDELGMSPIDFINQERIKLAASLLQNQKHSIKEVFMMCGFESRSYFNRVFKKLLKVSPGEYQAGHIFSQS